MTAPESPAPEVPAVADGPPSVLHVVPWIAERYGGPPRNVRDLGAALARKGVDVTVLTSDRDGRGRLSEEDRKALGAVHPWEVVAVPTRGPSVSAALLRKARELVRRSDLVHLHGIYSPLTALTGMIARRLGVPYVLQLHGAATEYDFNRKRWKKEPYDILVQRRLVAQADAVIAMTRMEADEGMLTFPASRMRTVPPPIVDELDEAAPAATGTRDRSDQLTIGFLGRISHKKGAPILLDAFRRIAPELPAARLVVAGPDDEGIGARMRADVDRLGLSDRVVFAGMVVGEEKAKLLGEFDVFALPSADESFGIAVVEAMDAAVPVVITDRVAVVDDVEAAGAGLVASRTGDSFANALHEILSDPAAAAEMGRAGRRRALERYSFGSAAEEMIALYREVCGPRRLATGPAARSSARQAR